MSGGLSGLGYNGSIFNREGLPVCETDRKITDFSESALQKTLEFYQNVISHMAENSRNCKTWCLTLVSAIAVWTFRVEQPFLLLFALLPAMMLWFLDAYYLNQERKFRQGYNAIVAKFHSGDLPKDDLYVVRPGGPGGVAKSPWSSLPQSIKRMFDSPSTLPFYGLLVVLLLVMLATVWWGPVKKSDQPAVGQTKSQPLMRSPKIKP